MTGKVFGQTPSSLLEIKDWSVARELDVRAAIYLHEEEMKREIERENRDREFWMAMFGSKPQGESEEDVILEDAMESSRLGTR